LNCLVTKLDDRRTLYVPGKGRHFLHSVQIGYGVHAASYSKDPGVKWLEREVDHFFLMLRCEELFLHSILRLLGILPNSAQDIFVFSFTRVSLLVPGLTREREYVKPYLHTYRLTKLCRVFEPLNAVISQISSLALGLHPYP